MQRQSQIVSCPSTHINTANAMHYGPLFEHTIYKTRRTEHIALLSKDWVTPTDIVQKISWSLDVLNNWLLCPAWHKTGHYRDVPQGSLLAWYGKTKPNTTKARISPLKTNVIQHKTRMWANAQRDGRPAEHRWRPLFNAAKFGWRPLLDAVQ